MVSTFSIIKKDENKFDRSYKKFKDLSDKVSDFLHKDLSTSRKYEKKSYEYLRILTEIDGLSDTDSAIHSYNTAYQQLYDAFKDVIPEIIQEEREKKLNKILVDTKN